MSAEDIWNQWQEFLQEDDDNSDEETNPQPADLNETIPYGEMAQAQAQVADMAALLGQLAQQSLDQTQRNIDMDARAVAAAQARGRDDNIRVSVSKIDKATGDDKPKLRRWLKDLTTLHATQAGIVVTVAERTARDNLADTIETFLADPINAPRVGILWPALQANI